MMYWQRLKSNFLLCFLFLVFLFFSTPCFSQEKQAEPQAKPAEPPKVEVKLDKNKHKGGDTIQITGKVPPGMKVNFIEITSTEAKVQVGSLDRKDFKFYLSTEIPAFYTIIINENYVAKIDKNGTIEEKPVK
jgi:hypothetical protein